MIFACCTWDISVSVLDVLQGESWMFVSALEIIWMRMMWIRPERRWTFVDNM